MYHFLPNAGWWTEPLFWWANLILGLILLVGCVLGAFVVWKLFS